MLNQLYIENIAVIEKATIDFGPGFNVLTGETGAGKSIIIDAIHAVLGQRTSRELVRSGAKGAGAIGPCRAPPRDPDQSRRNEPTVKRIDTLLVANLTESSCACKAAEAAHRPASAQSPAPLRTETAAKCEF